MKLTLEGDEVPHYFALRQLDVRVDALAQASTLIAQSLSQLGASMTTFFEQTQQQLTDLAALVTDARNTVVQTVSSETQEDVEQNQRLADKQAALDAAETEIVRLTELLNQAPSVAEQQQIANQITALSGQVQAIKDASVVTDPGAATG